MKIGLQIPDFTTPDGPPRLGADLATVARTADEGGFEFIALMDHFFQIRGVGPAEREMLEAYTTLGYLAACTSRAKLLTLVTGAVYRHPGVLAKIVTTLDVLSGGRAWLGIGAAWNEEESRGLGIPFPPVAERFERLSSPRHICRQICRVSSSRSKRSAMAGNGMPRPRDSSSFHAAPTPSHARPPDSTSRVVMILARIPGSR